jgi:hypothetical protein
VVINDPVGAVIVDPSGDRPVGGSVADTVADTVTVADALAVPPGPVQVRE